MTRAQQIQDELERLFRQWSVRAVPIGAVIFLLVAPLDFISVPELAGRFLSYRLAAAGGLLLLWYPVSQTRSPLALRAWILAGVVLGAVTIEVMILSQGGRHSEYSFGMILLAVTVLGLIPASVGFHVTISAAIYATFLVPLLLWGEAVPFRVFFTQNYLFVAILAVTVYMRHLHRTSLTREIGLAFDLQAKERDLETQVDERTDALVRAAAEWRATFDSVGDGILMIDRAGLTPDLSSDHPDTPPSGAPAGSLGAIIGAYKSTTTQRINRIRGVAGRQVWQRNYYERIIRSAAELDAIRQYIHDNPLNWPHDEHHPPIPGA